MNDQPFVPMAGLLRVVYFLAITSILIVLVQTGITHIYTAPGGEDIAKTATRVATSPLASHEESYDRNVGLIFSLIGGGIMVGSILGLPSPQNALRAGLLAAGLSVYFIGFGYASKGSSDWLVPIEALLAFGWLLAGGRYLNDGLDVLTRWSRPRSPTAE